MRHWIVVMVLLVSMAPNVAGSILEVAGRVVDQKGQPIAGVRVAENWFAEQSARLEPNRPALTDAEGRFSMEVTLYGRDTAVMAIDPAGGVGGLAVIPAKGLSGPIEIEVAPLVEVRGRFTCEESGKPPGETYATMFLDASYTRVAAVRSLASTFAMRLPPGRYLA